MQQKTNISGIIAALSTPIFLGMAPIFGKIAINAGADSFTVAALRTLVAIALLWVIYAIFFRKFIYIYPAGLMGCIVIGSINGIGSLFYYGGLTNLDAGLAQLLNGMYLAFALLISTLAGQKADGRTLLRVAMALVALILLTGFGNKPIDWTGVGMMLGAALMFAGTVILSQYVLYEMPAPTVTLYILTTMGIVVTVVWLAVGKPFNPNPEVVRSATVAIVLLGITTALSRLAMFAGVKFLGGMQTAILAIMEIGVALTLAFIVLGETLSGVQWLGVAVLFTSMLLIRQRDLLPRGFNPNALIVANMASVQFQQIAFHRAFGTQQHDNAEATMASLTTQEIQAIQQMMGAQSGPIDPFPIGKSKQINDMLDSLNNTPLPDKSVKRQPTTPDNLREQKHEIQIPDELREDTDEDDDKSVSSNPV